MLAGTLGETTCFYPGNLWEKTLDELDCKDVYQGSIPWSQNTYVKPNQLNNQQQPIQETTQFKQKPTNQAISKPTCTPLNSNNNYVSF